MGPLVGGVAVQRGGFLWRSQSVAPAENLTKVMDAMRRSGATPVQYPMEPWWASMPESHTFVNDTLQGKAGSLNHLRTYLTELTGLTYNCQQLSRVGSPNDGGYIVCEDVPWHGQHGCTMLSYGIAYDDNFEIAVSNKWGCQVHEFDPTVQGSAGSRQNPEKIHFHQEGIWSGPAVLSIGKVDSLANHMQTFWQPAGQDKRLA